MSMSFSDKYNIPKVEQDKIAIIIEITRLRKQGNLSQKELAERCHMKQPQIARIENLESNPTLETLLRILEVFDKRLAIV